LDQGTSIGRGVRGIASGRKGGRNVFGDTLGKGANKMRTERRRWRTMARGTSVIVKNVLEHSNTGDAPEERRGCTGL